MQPSKVDPARPFPESPVPGLTPFALLLLAISPLWATPSPPEIVSLKEEQGHLHLKAIASSGEMWIEQSSDLVAWEPTEYRLSQGSQESFFLPAATPGTPRFFRVVSYPATEGFYTHGPFASEAKELIREATLSSAFGLTGIDTTSGYPGFADLATAPRDRRIHAALAAGLARLAQELRDELGLSVDPSDLLQALETDLSDGTLDGTSGGQPVTIPDSTTTLPSDLSDADLVQAFQQARSLTPGLADTALTFSGGSYSIQVPALWDQSRWGSAEWQE